MSKLTLTLKYWLLYVLWPSIHASISFEEFGGKIVETVIQVAVGIFLIVVLGQAGQIPNFGLNLLTAVLVLLAVVGVRIIWNIFYLPARTFDEQGGFIKNPFDITDTEMNPSQAPGIQRLSFVVRNTSRISDIEDCSLVLHSVLDRNSQQQLLRQPQPLLWRGTHNPQGEQKITLDFAGFRLCDLAVEAREGAFFATRTEPGMEPTRIHEGPYELTIEARGKWKGQPISFEYAVDFSYIHGYIRGWPTHLFLLENMEESTPRKA